MRPADRPWASQPRSPADKRRNAGTVVRRHERRPGNQRCVPRQQASHRVDRGHLQRLAARQRRQQPRKTLRQHCFADTRWTSQHEVMRPGGGHLDGEPCLGLAHHIGEVRRRLGGGVGRGDPPGQAGGPA